MNAGSRSHRTLIIKCSALFALLAVLGYSLAIYCSAQTSTARRNALKPIGLQAMWPVPAPSRWATPPSLPTFTGDRTRCDVLVVGGTPSGVAAALAAARRGADVMLIESRPLIGGDIVYAMLNQFDIPARPSEASPVHGIFAEFFDQLGTAFSIDKARRLFEDTLSIEPTLHAYTRTRVTRIIKDGDRIVGVVLHGSSDSGHAQEAEVRARVFIDATNDASLAARAGAGYYLGRENANPDKAMQSAGMLFTLKGVDWSGLRKYIRGFRPLKVKTKVRTERTPDSAPSTARGQEKAAKRTPEKLVKLRLGGILGNYIWERGDLVRPYKPRGKHIMFLSINFGRQSDGSVVLNTLNLIGVNGLNAQSVTGARHEALAELPYFIVYLRNTIPALRNVRLGKAAPELYIRETRHIHGYYSLKVADIRAEKKFPDRVAMVSYPLDLHPYKMGEVNPFGARRYYYTLPLRSLIPRKVDGLFIASRSLSASYSAAGSARVIPITMSAGEAAGTAAWVCVRRGVEPHQLVTNWQYIREVQNSLREWGADVGDKYPPSRATPALRGKKHIPSPRPLPTRKPVGARH